MKKVFLFTCFLFFAGNMFAQSQPSYSVKLKPTVPMPNTGNMAKQSDIYYAPNTTNVSDTTQKAELKPVVKRKKPGEN